MKTETFRISESESTAFKQACEDTHGLKFDSIDKDNIVTVSYKFSHCLFYLGQMFQVKKQLETFA
jgi:hypothetical protein